MKVLVSGIKHSKETENTSTPTSQSLQMMLLDDRQSVYAQAHMGSILLKFVTGTCFDAAIHLVYTYPVKELLEHTPGIPESVDAGVNTLMSLAGTYHVKEKILMIFDDSTSDANESSDHCVSWIQEATSFCDTKGVALIVRSAGKGKEIHEIGKALRERTQAMPAPVDAENHDAPGFSALTVNVDAFMTKILTLLKKKKRVVQPFFQKQTKRLRPFVSGLFTSPVSLFYYSRNPLLRERSPMMPTEEVPRHSRLIKDNMDQNAQALGGWLKRTNSASKDDNKVFRDLEHMLLQSFEALYNFLEPALISIPFVIATYYLQKTYFLQLDFFIFYIVLINAYYGWHAGSGAVILSSAGYTWLRVRTENVSIARLLQDPNHMLYLALYLLIGVTVGFAIDHQRREQEALAKENESLQQDLAHAHDLYRKSLEVKDALQKSIENYENSLGKIYTIVSRLDTAIPEQIFEEAASVFSEMLKAKSVHIYYSTSSTYYRLATFRGQQKYPPSLRVEDFPFIHSVIGEQKTFTNHQFHRHHPMVCAPIASEGQLTSLVFLDGMPFTHLTQQYLNTLTVVCRLVSNAVLKAAQYEDAIHHKKYYGDTFIMRAPWFARLIAEKQEHSARNEDNVYLLEFMKNRSSHEKIYAKVSPLIRSMDYIGELDKGRYAILLVHVSEEEVALIESRLREKGIEVAEKEIIWGTA